MSAVPPPVPVAPIPLTRSEPPPSLDGWIVVGAAADNAEDRARALLAHFERAIAGHPERARLGRLHYECARLCESPLGDLARAAEHYAKALVAAPDHLPTLSGARRVLLAQGNHQAALAHYDTEVRLTQDPARKAVLLHEKALLLEHRLHGRKAALASLTQAVQLAPENAQVVESLALLQAVDDAWEALDHTLDLRVATVVDAKQRAALLAERARLAEARQHDVGLAAELYQASLTQDPRAPGALFALKELCHRQQRWRDLIQVLELEAGQAENPRVRALVWHRIARVQIDHLGSLEAGISALERAATETPEDAVVLGELARTYELAGRHDGYVRVMGHLVQLADTPSEKVGLLHTIAEVNERHLNAVDTAIEGYRSALAADATHLPTIAALERLHRQRGEWELLIATLTTAADAARDPGRRAAWHTAIGDLYEQRLARPDAAIEQYSRALGVLPGHAPAFRGLARLLETHARFRELVELHERAVDLAQDAETRIGHLFEIGLYLEDALRAPARAVEAYKRILRDDPKHRGAILAWQRAAERGLAWSELVSALEAETQQTTDKDRQATLLHRAGEVLAEHLEDLEGALERLRRVLALVPGHAPTLATMARLFERHGRWDDLLDTYRRELKTTPSGSAAAALLLKMGQLAERQLGRAEEALELYREAVAAMPTHAPARRALERSLEAAGKWAELVAALEQGLPLLEDKVDRARTATRVGQLLEGRLHDEAKALASYERALAEDPHHPPALDGRTRLLSAAKDAARLADALAANAENATEPPTAIAALCREGLIRRDELGDVRGAIRCFEAVLARDPRHLGALRALESLYTRERAWDGVVRVCTALDAVLTEPHSRVATLHRLARTQRVHAGEDADSLRGTYFSILKLEPNDVAALVALEELGIAAQDRRLLAQVDAKLAQLLTEPAASAAHQTRLGEALELADPPAALTLYRAALAQDPEDQGAALGLARIAERHTDIALLEEAATQVQRVLADSTTGASLLVRAAGVAQTTGDGARAAAALRHALELDPEHPAAAGQLTEVLLSAGDVAGLVDALTHAAQRARHRSRRDELWIAIAELQASRLQDSPAALATYERVLGDSPANARALLGQAELYCQDAQWEPATKRLAQALAQTTNEDARVDIRLRLAAIHDEHLRESDRALAHVNAVLAERPDHRGALQRLLSIQLRSRRHDAAAETAHRLVASAANRSEEAEARVTLAAVERARGNTASAIQELEVAIAVLGLAGHAADDYKALLLDQKRSGQPPAWRGYVYALERFLAEPGNSPEVIAQVQLELSQVLADELRQNDEALRALDRGLAAQADDPELHAARALRLEHAGDLGAAAEAIRRLLELQVTRASAWRSLSAILAKMQRPGDATLALAPLVSIGAATEADLARLAAIPCRAGLAPPGSLAAEEIDAFDPTGNADPIGELLALAGEVASKLYPADLARYGLSSRDRITARSGHPLRTVSDRVAAIFGVADHQLFEQKVAYGGLVVELTEPVSVIAPSFVAALPEPQQVFLFARVMASTARRLPLVHALPPEELDLFLAGTVAAVGGSIAAQRDASAVAEHGRKIARLLSRRTRRALEDRVPHLSASEPREVAEWLHRAQVIAARAALIVTDDLPGAVEIVRRLEGDLSGRTPAAAALGMRIAEDLLRFWVSETAFRLRRRLGFL